MKYILGGRVESTSVDLEAGWKLSQSGKHADFIDCRRQQIVGILESYGRFSKSVGFGLIGTQWIQRLMGHGIRIMM